MEQKIQTISPYHQHYISLVNSTDVIKAIVNTGNDFHAYINSLNELQGNYSYEKGKWSVKEITGHIADAERVFAYRALRFARNDKTPLPSFEQDDYVKAANFNYRTLSDLAEELNLIRASNIALFKTFSEEELSRTGIASGNNYSVRDLIYIIAGHQKHHLNILKEKYFPFN